MSNPVFIDIAVPDQTLELRGYLKSLGAEISEENADSGILTDLKNIVEASSICWKEINNESDIEMVFNGIITLILVVPEADAESVVTLFCEKVGKAPSGDKKASSRLRMLNNLFDNLDAGSRNRAVVLTSMVRLAGQTDLLSMVPTDVDKIRTWNTKWELSTAKLQNLYRTLYDALVECKASEQATKVMIELLGTYTEDNASQARDDAHKCIVTCLADPNTFLMDHLLALKPVKFLEGELIHDLLSIFVSGKLSQYQLFYKNNTDFVQSLGLNHESNMRKMRLLTFMQMAESRKEMDFALIQEELLLGPQAVEEFVIDVLKTKAVNATIDQIQKKVVVLKTTHRTFSKHHWQQIRQRLAECDKNLSTVEAQLGTLANIKIQQQQIMATPAQS
ncbi:eukaryotic translation initiation factor 3 subunit M-like [Littorina saxatilis]|uniref:Eukaryotic translation initiation factor 3 subunit M n=1 Tax=Littorina saxatilis TaxID=31220 RepID=A0AAN9B4G9_9CAEN